MVAVPFSFRGWKLPVKRKALLDGSAFSFGVYVLLGNGRKYLAGGEYAGGIFSGNIQTEYLDISATGLGG